jgi:hypothetical protein
VSSRARWSTFHAAPLALLLVAGCSSKAAPGTAPTPSAAVSAPPRARQDQQLITRDVILGTQYTNLYDVVQALRSNWLRVRAASSTGKQDVLQVYLDNQRIGGVEELRRIVPSTVNTVRYYDPVAAAARWGMDHGAGVIFVTTAK